jgi:hypothetical protein
MNEEFGAIVEELVDEKFEEADEMNFSISDFEDVAEALNGQGKIKWDVLTQDDTVRAIHDKDDVSIIFYVNDFGSIRDYDELVEFICDIEEMWQKKIKGSVYE